MSSRTLTVPTIDLSGIVAELDWAQIERGEIALEAMVAVESQAPAAYWDIHDEAHQTTLALTDDQYAVVKAIVDAIADESGLPGHIEGVS